jgi:hypothetical protein
VRLKLDCIAGQRNTTQPRFRRPLVILHIRFLRIPDRSGERRSAHVVGSFSDPLGDNIGMAGAAAV